MRRKRLLLAWTEARLSEVVEINPPKPENPPDDDTPVSFVPMAAVQVMAGGMDASETRPWRDVRKGYKRFQDGDVLFAKITPCMENGKLAVAKGLHNGVGAGSTEFHVLRPSAAIRPDLLAYYLLRADFRASARAKMKGTAGQLRVPQQFLEAQTLPVPPLRDQERIVETIDSHFTRLDNVTATLERVRRNLKRYRASILKAAVEGRLVPTEAELARAEGRDYEPASVLLERILAERRRRWQEAELARMKAAGKTPKNDRWKARYKEPVAPDTSTLPPVPEGWCWASVDQALSERLVNGRSVKTAEQGIPVLRLTSLRDGLIDPTECKIGAWSAPAAESFLVRKDDILISRGNGSIQLVGRGGLVQAHPGVVAFPDTLIRMRLCAGVDRRFFIAVWNSRDVRDQIERKAKTTAGIYKVNHEDVAACVLLLPPLAEQFRIRDTVEKMINDGRTTAEGVTCAKQRAATLHQAVLEWAFGGVLTDRDLEAAGRYSFGGSGSNSGA